MSNDKGEATYHGGDEYSRLDRMDGLHQRRLDDNIRCEQRAAMRQHADLSARHGLRPWVRFVLFLLLLAMIAVAAYIGAGRAVAQPTNGPSPTCTYLDTHPGVGGVEDIVVMALLDGMSPEDIGQDLFDVVRVNCPRHIPTLLEFGHKWADVAPAEHKTKT